MNKFSLVGRLNKEIELGEGNRPSKISLRVNGRKRMVGGKEINADFFFLIVWDKELALRIQKHTEKGMLIGVEGFTQNSYNSEGKIVGEDKIVTVAQFYEFKKQNADNQSSSNPPSYNHQQQPPVNTKDEQQYGYDPNQNLPFYEQR